MWCLRGCYSKMAPGTVKRAILVTVKLLLKIMREYLLKQPKATCVLFSIACKINLGLVKK